MSGLGGAFAGFLYFFCPMVLFYIFSFNVEFEAFYVTQSVPSEPVF